MPGLTFTISKEDILRSKVVTPGWYKMTIRNVTQEPASTDGSTNTIIDFLISEGEFAGVPIKRYFSEKAAGMAVNFFTACGATVGSEGATIEVEKCKGRTIMVYVINDMYNGRPTNKAEDFKPVGAALTQAAPAGAGTEAPKA
jgi:hypothetical protein